MSILPIAWLDEDDEFPPPEAALDGESDAPGLLAAGGDLSLARLRHAYSNGIFPWYSEGQPVLWWSPDPRMVLPTRELRLRRSFRKVLRRFVAEERCEVRIDSSFAQVIRACARTPRAGQDGTWILPEMVAAYEAWHARGEVHSFETWENGRLVGGLYGVALGTMFFGESMFSWRPDASKIALAALVAFCRRRGIGLIDCQQRTSHLASLGAREIPRGQFLAHVRQAVGAAPVGPWHYDRSMWNELGLDLAACA